MAKTPKKSRYVVEGVLDGDVVPLRSFDGEFMAALYAVKVHIRVRDTVTGREWPLTSAVDRRAANDLERSASGSTGL